MNKVLAVLILLCLPLTAAHADNARDAAKHFQRGVDLYSDGDFRGALVEFKKAYDTWPRANVLYDIGQTQFQLLDYAGALRTMERYLAETGSSAPHRTEVETTVETLRGRVGHLMVSAEPGCEITVDDSPAGNTPLDAPILVSVGPRRVNVLCSGGRSVQKRVDVAAGETQRLDLQVPAAPIAAVRMAMSSPVREKKPSQPGKGYITAWVVTGVLVAGTVAVGSTTLVEQGKLASMRNTFPVSKEAIDRTAGIVTGLAITSDVLGAAAIVAAGVSTYLTIKYERSKHVKVGLSARGVQVGGVF
jgi:PEGA domain-containing protein